MRLLVCGALLVGGLSVVSCGSDSATSGSPSGGAGGAGTAGAGGNAGESDAALGESGEPGSAGAGAAAKSGFIGVTSQATAAATVFNNGVNAGFFDGPGNTFPKGCDRQVVGACQVLICDYTNGGDQSPSPGAVTSAGTLTVGGTTPMLSLEYDAGTMKYAAVPAVPTNKLLFAGGDTISFAAAGGDVPAFAASVVAPTPVTVTSPALPSDFSIDTSKDLVFEWTGRSVGALAFNVRTTTTSAAMTVALSFVSCQFPASALTGTIPKALLQQLTKTDATTTAILGTDLSSTKEAPAGDYLVHLAVGSIATQADGKSPYAASAVTIQ